MLSMQWYCFVRLLQTSATGRASSQLARYPFCREREEMEQKSHLILLPLPFMGHMNPMMRLAEFLATGGHLVTFVSSIANHRDVSPTAQEALLRRGIRLMSIPDGLPEDADRTTQVVELCESLLSTMPGPFKELLATLTPPPSCVIADTFLPFTVSASISLGIPHVSFWTQSMASLASLFLVANNLYKGPTQELAVPGAAFLTETDMNTFIRCYEPSNFMYRFILGGLDRLHLSEWVVVNTFIDLERETIEILRKQHGLHNLLAVGPLLPLPHEASARNIKADDPSIFRAEDRDCISWLNKREPKSVLYVSFGSLALLSETQMEDVALGLEACGYPFLWVVRSDIIHGRPPKFMDDYLQRVKDRVFIVAWGPQLQVLRHPAIGGFFTHGGWNSTIEAISAGVPMLGWPYFADQPMDCACIEGWGLGLRLGGAMSSDKIVGRDTIETKVRLLMSSKMFQESSHDMKIFANRAVSENGYSKDLQTLMKSLQVAYLKRKTKDTGYIESLQPQT
ncbi:hypothetical protein KP509_01G101200 [Ceratopteris richardii]|uniref:Glycosyltransferase n=1 Tax=Ceratopteris richardii TaxID=49495 RepID=A0A8T2VSB1_CERRI|nr:hypothetical protein KP509_01G101200 [Ceratopteris richardii]